MNWKTIFNPFEKFDEKILLIAGIISFVIIIPANVWTNTYFTSIYRINNSEKITYFSVIVHNFISYTSAIVILFILGKLLYKKTRIIDIVNTVLISQIPLIIILPLQKIKYIKTVGDRVAAYQTHPSGASGVFPILDFILMILIVVISVGAMIYSIVLYYNGFRTATNIKKWQDIVLFCVVTFLMVSVCQILNN